MKDVKDDAMIGVAALLSLGLLHEMYMCLLRGYAKYGMLLIVGAVLTPLAVILTWAIGHIIHGLGRRTRCSGCDYQHGNIFTRWFHRRRCLPYLTNL